jgi:urease accessory protein
MQRCNRILRRSSFDPAEARDRVTLDYDNRFRRRFRLFTDNHQDILLDFEECEHMHDGDAIQLNDGSLILVCARPEELLEITAPDGNLLLRIAWHLGNCHLPVQFGNGVLFTRDNHVIAKLVRDLGANVRAVTACFDPEKGSSSGHGRPS